MKYTLIILSLALALGSCKKKSTACDSTPGTTVASADEEAMVTKYLDSMSITNAVELEGSGMYYVIDTTGNSKRAGQCSTVTLKYNAHYRNGVVFDHTADGATAVFTLNMLIEGWKRGIPLIGEGGVIRLFIPPSLGYGLSGYLNPNTGQYYILPNAVLIFEVKLVDNQLNH